MLHVVDVSSLLAAGWRADANFVLQFLDDLVKDETLCYPDAVLHELKQRARGEFTYTWAKAVGDNRCSKSVAYGYIRLVSESVPDLVDEEAQTASSAPEVLAQACALRKTDPDVCVVTEDVKDKPTRLALATACDRLEVPHMRLNDCLSAAGYSP